MFRALLISLLLLALSAPPGFAQTSPKPLIDPGSRCGVYALPNIMRSTPNLKWSGPCRDGLADGKGVASFSALANGKPSRVWDGYFRQGYFVGERPLKNEVAPLAERSALIELPSNAAQEGRIWLHAPMDSEDGALLRCGRGRAELAVEAPHDLAPNDEPRLRRMMQRAAIAYRETCPAPLGLALHVVAAGNRQVLATGSFGATGIIARASLAEGAAADAIHGFQNVATGESDMGRRAQQHADKRQQERAQSRTNWQEFTRANSVALWATPKQLDLNPFNYQNRIVAFPARFERMLASGTALLRDSRWGTVMVSGLPDTLLQDKSIVVIAGRVTGRKSPPNSHQEITSVDAIAWKLCQRAGCADYLDWIDEEKRFTWGEDQSAFK